MFSKLMFFVAFLLASFSLCVEGVKMSGSNIITVDHSLAQFAARNDLTRAPECFSQFSDNQAKTVRKLGEDWQVCGVAENIANENMSEKLKKVSYEIAKVPDDICVQIDYECRNKFATDQNIEAAFDCYKQLTIPARAQIMEMADRCKLAILYAENESRSIKSTKKNCTNQANFDYLKDSDILFENLVTTCDSYPSEGPTTLATTTTQSTPIESTTPILSEVSSTTEVVRPWPTEPWQTKPTTRRGRFPWN